VRSNRSISSLGRERSRAWRAAVAVTLLAVLGIAGCGGAGTYNDAIGQLAPPGTELPLATPVVTAPAAPATVPTIAAFCQDFETLQALLPTLLQADASSAMRARAQALEANIQREAPDAIRAAVQQLAQSELRLITDLSAKPPHLADAATTFTDPAYQLSLREVGSYAFSHC
jgi:hypothetical protein